MNKSDLKKQRELASSMIREMTGKKLRHSKTGRPFIGRSIDTSISHSGDSVGVAMVPSPYRIGIDLEQLNLKLNSRLFIGSVIGDKEAVFLKKFCADNDLVLSSGVAIFWSVKESFFKCLDYDLIPGKISILNISKSGRVRFGFSDEIKKVIEDRSLKIHSVTTSFKKGYIFSQTVMVD